MTESEPIVGRKRKFFTLLLCLWIVVYYCGVWNGLTSRLTDQLAELEDPIYFTTFQRWVFNIIGILFDSAFVGLAVGLFAYLHRGYKPIMYVILGVFLGYFLAIPLLGIALYSNSIKSILQTIDDVVRIVGYEGYILVILKLLTTLIASYVGYRIAVTADYIDPKDDNLGYISGVSKKVLALLVLPFNAVMQLATKFSIVAVFELSNKVTTSEYWDWNFFSDSTEGEEETGLSGILINILMLFMVWAIVAGIFIYGINAIRDKRVPFRRSKIVGIFVILPALIVGIQLIRNRTFFF